MRESFTNALAPGTVKNHRNQASLYIKFMLLYRFNYLFPNTTQIAMYSQFLANSYTSPNSIRNYMSGAKNWVLLHMGDTQPFVTYELGTLVKSYSSKSRHIPSKAAPISPTEVTSICQFIDDNPHLPKAIKPAILIAYSAMLRVSNILSSALQVWDGPHTLQTTDIITTPDSLRIIIRSTKTTNGPKPAIIEILRTGDHVTFPWLAWTSYKADVNPCPLGPAFILLQGIPLTTPPVVAVMRSALQLSGHPDPNSVSFHSLRRGGAQTAIFAGAPEQQVMNHGLWKSRAGLAAYLPSPPRTVPRILARALATGTSEDTSS